jgi:hypothetical protein
MVFNLAPRRLFAMTYCLNLLMILSGATLASDGPASFITLHPDAVLPVATVVASAEAQRSKASGKMLRDAHAIPPVGWRRTNRGWELFDAEAYASQAQRPTERSWFVDMALQVRRVPPPFIALGMLAVVLLPTAVRQVGGDGLKKFIPLAMPAGRPNQAASLDI